MPYVELPERWNLRLFYISNPIQDGGEIKSRPLDYTRHTIVFFHAGTSSSAGLIKQQLDLRLASTFNLLFMDAPHHGGTIQDDKKMHTVENSADDLRAALNVLQVPSYTLFGEGVNGGNCAVFLTLKEPQKVKGLILASPGPMREDPAVHDSLMRLIEAMSIHKDGRGDATGRIEKEVLYAVGEYFVGGAPRLQASREAAELAFDKRYGTGHSSHDMRWILLSGAEREPPSAAELASIRCPVLVLSGSEDKVISPLPAAEEWKNSFKGAKGGATVASISGAPHLMSMSDYSIVNRMILQFTKRALEV